MKRREFSPLLVGTLLASPVSAVAQSLRRAQKADKPRRIGVVMAYTEDDPNGQQQVAAFKEQLQELGWSEGNNIQIEVRYAADNPALVKAFANELLKLQSELLVSFAGEPHTLHLALASRSFRI